MLSADDTPNAFIFSGITPPTIVFSVGLIKLVDSVDQLAAVMAHELNHDYLDGKLGEHDVGKFDEVFSDVAALPMLQRAGSRRDALRIFLEKLPESRISIFKTLQDPHPRKENRIRALEIAEDKLTRPPHGSGQQSFDFSPVPTELQSVRDMPPYESHVLRELKSRGFGAAVQSGDSVAQITILAEVIRDELPKLADPVLQGRQGELLGAIAMLNFAPGDPAHEAAIAELVDAIVIPPFNAEWDLWGSCQEELYGQLVEVYALLTLDPTELTTLLDAPDTDIESKERLCALMREARQPIGNIRTASEAISRFLNASTQAEAEEAAKIVNELAGKYLDSSKTAGFVENRILRYGKLPATIDWLSHQQLRKLPGYHNSRSSNTPPTTGAIVPPWSQQLAWAHQSDSPEINIALRNLRVNHPHLPDLTDSQRARVVPRPRDVYSAHDFPGAASEQYRYNEQGAIIGVVRPDADLSRGRDRPKSRFAGVVERSQLRAVRYLESLRVARERRREDHKILQNSQWKEDLRTDFPAFVEKYSHQLRLEGNYGAYNCVPNTPFIAAFTKELTKLVELDLQRWGPIVREFLAGGSNDNKASDKDAEHSGQVAPLRQNEWKFTDRFLAPNHPYVVFALNNPGGALDVKTRAFVLRAGLYSPGMLTKRPEWSIQTPADIGPFLEKMHEWRDSCLHYLIPHHVEKYLSSNTLPIPTRYRVELLGLLNGAWHTASRQRYIDLVADLKGELPIEELIQNYRLNCSFQIRKITSQTISDEGQVTELIKDYIDYRGAFSSPQVSFGSLGAADTLSAEDMLLKHRYEGKLIAELRKLAGPDRSAEVSPDRAINLGELAQSLLFSREHPLFDPWYKETVGRLRYDATLSNSALRNLLVEAYVAGKVALLGIESHDNSSRIRATIDEIASETAGELRFLLISELLKGVQAQSETSDYGREKLGSLQLAEAARSQFVAGIGTEVLGATLEADPAAQVALQEFLLQPLSGQSLRKAEESLREAKIRAERNNPWHHMGSGLQHGIFGARQPATRKKSPSPEERNAHGALRKLAATETKETLVSHQLRSFHQNFWAQPFPLRELAIQPVIFPIGTKAADNFEGIKRSILDRVLPRQSDVGTELLRALVECYLDVSPVPAQRALLCGMVVARQPTGDGQHGLNRGEAIKVLELMGPAGRKILQAIHSHPCTAKDLKDSAKDSKSMAALPFHWEVHDWLKTFGPLTNEHVRASTHVGAVIGAGAWGVTVELSSGPADKRAVTLLRPDAREQAELEFDTIDRALEQLERRFPHFDTTVIRQLVREARRMSLLEADMAVSKMQSKLAAENTDGFQIEVQGHRYNFSTAQWLGHGTNYKETRIVAGTHFNDLPAQQKPALAKAILTKELYLRLSGLATDHDRHGAQQRILVGADETTIGEFDFGGMALRPPTPIEKELLAHAVRTALRQSRGLLGTGIGAKPFGDTLSKVVQDMSKSPYRSNMILDRNSAPTELSQEDVAQILGTFQRDVLALCDYVSALGSNERQRAAALADIFKAVLQTGDVDPIIIQTLQAELGWIGRLGLSAWMRATSAQRILIRPPKEGTDQ